MLRSQMLGTAVLLAGMNLAACTDDAVNHAPDAGQDAASPDAPLDGLVVFVSSTVASGDSMANASALCQDLDDTAGLGGSFVAWTSSATANAIDSVTGAGPWRLTSGDVAFANAASLASPPAVAIDRNERGELVSDALVFTGTGSDGIYTGEACEDWTSYYDYSDATVGAVASAASWTSSEVVHCGRPRRFYCFEVE